MSAISAPPEAAELVRRLFVLLKAAAVYGPENEGYRTHAEAARAALSGLLAEGPVRVEARQETLFCNERPIRFPPGDAGSRFLLAELARRGAGGVEFRDARAPAQVDAFAAAFRRTGGACERPYEELSRLLAASGGAIAVFPPAVEDDEEDASAAARPVEPADAALRAFFRALEVVEELMTRVREGRDADLSPAKSAVEGLARQVVDDAQALFELSILQRFDEYTYAHCVNVSVYSVAIGHGLGLGKARLEELGFGALFHDLGKSKLPLGLINKPDALDEDDWRLMRLHPELGAKALLAMPRPMDASLARAVTIAFEHHLGLDGKGYPRLPRTRRQDLFSRICAVADAFDAMTSGRVYVKRALAPDEALRRMLQAAGTAFDPLLLRVFIGAAGVFPIGTAVELESGEKAVVARNGEDLLRPTLVRLDDGREVRGTIRRTLEPREHGIDARAALAARRAGAMPPG